MCLDNTTKSPRIRCVTQINVIVIVSNYNKFLYLSFMFDFFLGELQKPVNQITYHPWYRVRCSWIRPFMQHCVENNGDWYVIIQACWRQLPRVPIWRSPSASISFEIGGGIVRQGIFCVEKICLGKLLTKVSGWLTFDFTLKILKISKKMNKK